jgi:CYTH domain-containing protein
VDIYLDENKIIIEVEFMSDESMDSFIPPSWFGEEIKEKKSYSYEKFCEINSNVLWRGL